MMAFGWAAFESERRRVLRPIASPIEHVVIRKVVPRCLPLDGHSFQVRVVPNQRPEIFGVDLPKFLQPISHTLRLATVKALRDAIKQVVVSIEVSLRMGARI